MKAIADWPSNTGDELIVIAIARSNFLQSYENYLNNRENMRNIFLSGGAEDAGVPQQQGEQGDGGAGQADVVDGEVGADQTAEGGA